MYVERNLYKFGQPTILVLPLNAFLFIPDCIYDEIIGVNDEIDLSLFNSMLFQMLTSGYYAISKK